MDVSPFLVHLAVTAIGRYPSSIVQYHLNKFNFLFRKAYAYFLKNVEYGILQKLLISWLLQPWDLGGGQNNKRVCNLLQLCRVIMCRDDFTSYVYLWYHETFLG